MDFHCLRKNRHLKKIFCTAFASALCISAPAQAVYADTLTEAKQAKQEAEDKLSDAEAEMKSLEKKRKKILKKIDTKNSQLLNLLSDIGILEDEIKEKEVEISKTKENCRKAQEEKEHQSDLMRLRIQYLYENGDTDMMTALISGKNISDALNHATFAKEIYSYDRKLLDEYAQAVQKVEDLLAELEEEESDMEEKQESLKEKKKDLEKKIADLEKKSGSAKQDLKNLKKSAEQYKKTIQEQDRIIEQQVKEMLAREEEARKAAEREEAARIMAASSSQSDSKQTYVPSGNGTGNDIVNYALQFVGNPYVYGGNSLTGGIDCSGFVQQVYAHFGYSLPRTSDSQAGCGRAVSASDLQPGDLVCYSGHIAIYIGGGRIVHASCPRTGIKISNNIFYRTVTGFRRITA